MSKTADSLLKAKMTCESFGMELIAPETEAEDARMRKFLKELEGNLPNGILLGLSSKGNDESYYSVTSGKVVSFDMSWSTDDGRHGNSECVYLDKDQFEGEYSYNVAHCYESSYKYICRKTVVNGKRIFRFENDFS